MIHRALVALAGKEGEARWYGGVHIFAGLETDRADDAMAPEMKRLEALLREALWAVAHGNPAAGPFTHRFPDCCL